MSVPYWSADEVEEECGSIEEERVSATAEAYRAECAKSEEMMRALKRLIIGIDATSHHLPEDGWKASLLADSAAAYALVKKHGGAQ